MLKSQPGFSLRITRQHTFDCTLMAHTGVPTPPHHRIPSYPLQTPSPVLPSLQVDGEPTSERVPGPSCAGIPCGILSHCFTTATPLMRLRALFDFLIVSEGRIWGILMEKLACELIKWVTVGVIILRVWYLTLKRGMCSIIFIALAEINKCEAILRL